jgi:hypothetical protein
VVGPAPTIHVFADIGGIGDVDAQHGAEHEAGAEGRIT